MGSKRGELSVGDTGSPGSLSTAQDTEMGGKYLLGVMKSFFSPLLQHATGPNISLRQVHTPSSLLHFGNGGGGLPPSRDRRKGGILIPKKT